MIGPICLWYYCFRKGCPRKRDRRNAQETIHLLGGFFHCCRIPFELGFQIHALSSVIAVIFLSLEFLTSPSWLFILHRLQSFPNLLCSWEEFFLIAVSGIQRAKWFCIQIAISALLCCMFAIPHFLQEPTMNNGEWADVVQCQSSTNRHMCNCIVQLASAGKLESQEMLWK